MSVVSEGSAEEYQVSLAFELPALDGVGNGLFVDGWPGSQSLEKSNRLEVAVEARHVPARVPHLRSKLRERAENGNVST